MNRYKEYIQQVSAKCLLILFSVLNKIRGPFKSQILPLYLKYIPLFLFEMHTYREKTDTESMKSSSCCFSPQTVVHWKCDKLEDLPPKIPGSSGEDSQLCSYVVLEMPVSCITLPPRLNVKIMSTER